MDIAGQIERLVARGFTEEKAEIVTLMLRSRDHSVHRLPGFLRALRGSQPHPFSRQHAAFGRLGSAVNARRNAGRAPNDGGFRRGFKTAGSIVGIRPQDSNQYFRGVFQEDYGLAGEIEEHTFESAASKVKVTLRAASKDLLLLQKAEAFLRRRTVKVRDAYDAKLLVEAGATFDSRLKKHLEDDLRWEEIGAEQLRERIKQIDPKRCRAELANILPEKTFNDLREKDFQSLRDVFLKIFEDWLQGELPSRTGPRS